MNLTKEKYEEYQQLALDLQFEMNDISYTPYEEAIKYCNGVGPEWFPSILRDVIDALHPLLFIASLNHDINWSKKHKKSTEYFLASNKAFLVNCQKLAKWCYCWINPFRYWVIHRAKQCHVLLDKFGGIAYNKACEKSGDSGMTQIFNNYSEHKVFDIIKANGFKKILIRLKAGLGDAMMFRAVCLPALKDAVEGLYSACADIIDVDVQVHNGQHVIFAKKDVYCGDLSYYEAVFELEFPDNCFTWEGADTLTKPEVCLRDELGLPYYNAKEYYLGSGQHKNSCFVGIHLFSTCYAGLNCPEEFARNLWRQIADNGLIPLDTYIETPGGKNRYKPYDFETQNLKGVTPGVDKLSRVISSCAGFASVSSGNFFLALQYMPPQKILFLQTIFRPVKLTRLPVHVVDAKAPYNSATEKAVQDWIDDFKGEHY